MRFSSSVEKTMYELKHYRTQTGEKTVLVGPQGRKLVPVLIIEGSGLTVKKLPLSEQRYMRDAPLAGRKTMKGVVRQYRSIGNRLGMTKAAKSFLTEAQKAA
jgi:hypothetical protein